MFWLGKLLGALFGYMIAGPIGAVFGLFLGQYFDLSRQGHWQLFPLNRQQQHHTQNIFFSATFTIMGFIAKSDGRVSENEIRAATRVMQNMLLTSHQKQQAIQYFRQGKQADFDIDEILTRLNNACLHQRNLLHLFVELQIQAAFADGMLTHNKQKILKYVCQRLNLNSRDFFSQSYTYENAYSHHYQHPQEKPPNQLEKSYKILGVNTSISNNDLKKAYRKLMSQNHPDKLVSKGLPEEMIKLATQKTQEIKLAYETICKARGI